MTSHNVSWELSDDLWESKRYALGIACAEWDSLSNDPWESKGYALGIACTGWDSDADPLLLILRTICVQSGTDQETFLRPDGRRFTI